MLTQEELKEQLYYNQETGVFTRLISNHHSVKVGGVAGCVDGSGYIHIRVNNNRYKAHRLAWLYVSGNWPAACIDHINGNRVDNRIINLRECSILENAKNAGKKASNTSGFKGVNFDKQSGKYRARCWLNGKSHSLGLFSDINYAAQAYIDFAKNNHGSFIHSSLQKQPTLSFDVSVSE